MDSVVVVLPGRISILIPLKMIVGEGQVEIVFGERCVRQRAVESEHVVAGGQVTKAECPVIVISDHMGRVGKRIILRFNVIGLNLVRNPSYLSIVIEVEVLDIVDGDDHRKVNGVIDVVPDHRILECGSTVGSVSIVGGVVDDEYHFVGIDLSDRFKCFEPSRRQSVRADIARNECNVSGLEGVVVKGSVESDGLKSDDGVGDPVCSIEVIDGEIAGVIDGSNLSIDGVDAVVTVTVVGVGIGVLPTADRGSVDHIGSPGEGDVRISKRLCSVVTLARVGFPGVIDVHEEFHIGCVGVDVCVGSIRVAHGCKSADHHDRCDHECLRFHFYDLLARY